MTWGSNKLHFTYDSIGPASVTYNGNRYFYLKNAQGDVTGLVNASGTQVVSYTYDPWGAPLSTDGTMASTLGTANPLRCATVGTSMTARRGCTTSAAGIITRSGEGLSMRIPLV